LKKRRSFVREIIEVIVLALLIFLALRFTIQNYQVNDASMDHALSSGQFVLINKVAYLFRSPERGDVIVCYDPEHPDRQIIKRIIGVPGDTIKTDGSNVWVNGVQLNEPYVSQKWNPGSQTWTVTANSYFIMGDNRTVSRDSRFSPLLPKDYIVGKAVSVYWPLNQWHNIDTYQSVYANNP
jgi:signal peptidase I